MRTAKQHFSLFPVGLGEVGLVGEELWFASATAPPMTIASIMSEIVIFASGLNLAGCERVEAGTPPTLTGGVVGELAVCC